MTPVYSLITAFSRPV